MARGLLTENILLAHENFHALPTNDMCRYNYMAINTDMSKVYDPVEWDFVRALLLKLGFAEKWVHIMMFCVCHQYLTKY